MSFATYSLIGIITCVKFLSYSLARTHGATPEEIQSAVLLAKGTTGWTSYLHGMQMDLGEFKKDVRKICDFILEKERRKAAA